MSLPVGYQPERIATLDRRTREAIADLRTVRSTDAAAGPAMRTVLRAQWTLEEHWMPLIMAIRASSAMTSWTQSVLQQLETVGTQLEGWFNFVDTSGAAVSYADLTDEQLLRDLYIAGDVNLALTGKTIDELITSDDQFWSEDFPAYADEFAVRVAADPTFAALASDSVGHIPLIAVATRYADFPESFVVALAGQMFLTPQWANSVYSAGALALTERLTAFGPDTVLDALLEPSFSLAILQPSGLPDSAVDAVLTGGLYDAVMADSTRLADGARVLQTVTQHVTGPLDSGMRPAAAAALAFTMRGYLPHIAPGVRFEDDDSPVRMVDADGRRLLELGTYPEVSDLFGTIMRDRDAQLLIGVALGAYTDEVITGLGGDLLDSTELSSIAHFGDLLRESLSDEQLEMVAAAAAATARRERVGDIIGFGVDVAQTASVVGSATKELTERGIEALTERLSTVDPVAMPSTSLRRATYDNITLSVVAMLVTTPSVRPDLGVESVDDEQWDRIAVDLDVVDQLEPGPERATAIFDLERTIATTAPDVDAVLGQVRSREGVGELTEATD